jgi:hypothetical protein
MKLYENFFNDGTLTNFYGGKTDSGFKLQINGEEKMKEETQLTKDLTPVEWLAMELRHCIEINNIPISPKLLNILEEQAKEMEKEQIMKTARQCYFEGVRKRAKTTEELIEYAEQYYNETFKSE